MPLAGMGLLIIGNVQREKDRSFERLDLAFLFVLTSAGEPVAEVVNIVPCGPSRHALLAMMKRPFLSRRDIFWIFLFVLPENLRFFS